MMLLGPSGRQARRIDRRAEADEDLVAELRFASRSLRRHAAAGERSPRVDASSWAKLLDRTAAALAAARRKRAA